MRPSPPSLMSKSPRSRGAGGRSAGIRITPALLRRFALPQPGNDDDKDKRGKVLVVGGEESLPGALILAGIAALRAGAGKLQIATCRSIASSVGTAVPESMSLGLRETRQGTIDPKAARDLRDHLAHTDALVIGPGMQISVSNSRFVLNVLKQDVRSPVVLDAGALAVLQGSPQVLHRCDGDAVLTPHTAEMAAMLGVERDEIDADVSAISLRAAQSFGAVVALKGPQTFIATPQGELYRYESGDVGLATSGSGDALAGIVAGLLARGAPPAVAAMWGVFLHGAAGNLLVRRMGRIGYLARELLDEIPIAMNRLNRGRGG